MREPFITIDRVMHGVQTWQYSEDVVTNWSISLSRAVCLCPNNGPTIWQRTGGVDWRLSFFQKWVVVLKKNLTGASGFDMLGKISMLREKEMETIMGCNGVNWTKLKWCKMKLTWSERLKRSYCSDHLKFGSRVRFARLFESWTCFCEALKWRKTKSIPRCKCCTL